MATLWLAQFPDVGVGKGAKEEVLVPRVQERAGGGDKRRRTQRYEGAEEVF